MSTETNEERIHRKLTAAPFPDVHRFVMDRLARVMAEELDRLRTELRSHVPPAHPFSACDRLLGETTKGFIRCRLYLGHGGDCLS